MNKSQIEKEIANPNGHNETDEEWIRSMFRDFYSRKMLSIVIIVWVWAIIFIVGAVYTGIQFFKADQTKYQILYSALFICCFSGICLMKVFALMMANKHSLKRDIKRLELAIARLEGTCTNK